MHKPHVAFLFALGLLFAGCTPHPAATSVGETRSHQELIPDYTLALSEHAHDYLAFVRSWLAESSPELESGEFVRYALNGDERATQAGAERLLAGFRAYCAGQSGEVVSEPPALTCVTAGGKALARLSVSVFHASEHQPASLQISAESPAWLARLSEERMNDYRLVLSTLAGNGLAGNVLLSSGENFEVVRFGRLSSPDFYALKTPQHGLIWFSDLVSVKWSEQGLSAVERDGDRFEEIGTELTPSTTIVRLRPTLDNQLKAEPLSADEPFRFVYFDTATQQPRQARVRADRQILQITIASSRNDRYRAGAINARFDKQQQAAFRKSLMADARKTAANTGKRTDRVNLDDEKLRSDLDQVGRVGPCARTQSENRLRNGDIALTEYLVCAEYRQEADIVKSSGGEVTPDKTPLLFLGRAARAPWYDFNGVLR